MCRRSDVECGGCQGSACGQHGENRVIEVDLVFGCQEIADSLNVFSGIGGTVDDEDVIAGAADHDVLAQATGESVVSRAANQRIVARSTEKRVIAVAAGNGVPPAVSAQTVIERRSNEIFDRIIRVAGCIAEIDGRCAQIGANRGRCIAVVGGVAAQPTAERVASRSPRQDVIAVASI